MVIRTLLAWLILPACRGLGHRSSHDGLVVPETYWADRRGLEVDLSNQVLTADIAVVAHIDFADVLVVDLVDGLVANRD